VPLKVTADGKGLAGSVRVVLLGPDRGAGTGHVLLPGRYLRCVLVDIRIGDMQPHRKSRAHCYLLPLLRRHRKRNCAGKSTTMRVILGLDAPDQGTALVGGCRYQSLSRPLTHVGALLDAAALQPSRSARNHLLWLAHSQGLTASRVNEVVRLSGLESAIRRKAGGYSLGMRQRLGIAAALLGDPPVLMLAAPPDHGYDAPLQPEAPHQRIHVIGPRPRV
jgi:ABC transporter